MRISEYNSIGRFVFKRPRTSFVHYFSVLLTALILGVVCFACDDDDDEVDEVALELQKQYEEYQKTHNELDYLQNSLVKVDEYGNIIERVVGTPFNPDDPDELIVGVKDLKEAKNIFLHLFLDTTAVSMDRTIAVFTTMPGQAELSTKPNPKVPGHIATAIFNVPGLEHVSNLHFIDENEWPLDIQSNNFYKQGMLYTIENVFVPKDKFKPEEPRNMKFLCIREYSKGKPAVLISTSNEKHRFNSSYLSSYVPSVEETQEICKILHDGDNWNRYQPICKENNIHIGEWCWVNNWGFAFFYTYAYVVNTADKEGQNEWKDVQNRYNKWHFHYLLYLKSGNRER